MKFLGWVILVTVTSCSLARDADQHQPVVPLGLDEFIPVPEDNPSTAAKIELGRQLFFDKRLSRDGTVSCATCHIPERAFTDGRRVSVGVKGRAGHRNAPSILNRAYGRAFFWDGRSITLEDQPLQAITNRNEMDLTIPELEKRLNNLRIEVLSKPRRSRGNEAQTLSKPLVRETPDVVSYSFENGSIVSHKLKAPHPAHSPSDGEWVAVSPSEGRRATTYRQQFQEVFGDKPTAQNAAKALASFVRTLLSGNSPFDRFEHGDQNALSESAKRGLQIFRGKGNCIACHSGPLLSDEEFHNTGVSWGKTPLDLGRHKITKHDADRDKFKTPSLRNVALTAPYMHDGSIATLSQVVEFYSKGANPNPNLDPEIRPLDLTSKEKGDLLAFLETLSGEPSANLRLK